MGDNVMLQAISIEHQRDHDDGPGEPREQCNGCKLIEYAWRVTDQLTALRARLQAVEGELYELDREYGPIRALLDHEGKNLKKIIEEREQAEQRVAALRKFTSHLGDCSLGKHGHPYEGVCDCGLDAALAAATPGEPLYIGDGYEPCRRCGKTFGAHVVRNTKEYPRGVACCPVPTPTPETVERVARMRWALEAVPLVCVERHVGAGPFTHDACFKVPDYDALARAAIRAMGEG